MAKRKHQIEQPSRNGPSEISYDPLAGGITIVVAGITPYLGLDTMLQHVICFLLLVFGSMIIFAGFRRTSLPRLRMTRNEFFCMTLIFSAAFFVVFQREIFVDVKPTANVAVVAGYDGQLDVLNRRIIPTIAHLYTFDAPGHSGTAAVEAVIHYYNTGKFTTLSHFGAYVYFKKKRYEGAEFTYDHPIVMSNRSCLTKYFRYLPGDTFTPDVPLQQGGGIQRDLLMTFPGLKPSQLNGSRISFYFNDAFGAHRFPVLLDGVRFPECRA